MSTKIFWSDLTAAAATTTRSRKARRPHFVGQKETYLQLSYDACVRTCNVPNIEQMVYSEGSSSPSGELGRGKTATNSCIAYLPAT